MKKSVFMLIAILCMTLTSCSWFESEPTNPKVIGIGNLQYDAVHNFYYAEFDSVRYSIVSVTIPSKKVQTYYTLRDMPPVIGSKVTVFTSNLRMGTQAVIGELSAEQIENLFKKTTLTPGNIGLMFMLALIFWWLSIDAKEWYQEKKAKREKQNKDSKI